MPQLQTLLFDDWIMREVEGRSTKEFVLATPLGNELVTGERHEFLKTLLEYRGVSKLEGTYCKGI